MRHKLKVNSLFNPGLNTWHTRRDKLEHSHLGSSILHGNAIGSEVEVGLSSADISRFSAVQMTINNLKTFITNEIKISFRMFKM